jgi:hypothetical protein
VGIGRSSHVRRSVGATCLGSQYAERKHTRGSQSGTSFSSTRASRACDEKMELATPAHAVVAGLIYAQLVSLDGLCPVLSPPFSCRATICPRRLPIQPLHLSGRRFVTTTATMPTSVDLRLWNLSWHGRVPRPSIFTTRLRR